jgi:two-component system chemotaxis response regulator CheB
MAIALITIGASLGGLDALGLLFAALPKVLSPTLTIVIHRRPDEGSGLAEALASKIGRPVIEPEDGETLEPGTVYLAPADYHLLIESRRFRLSTEAPVNFARPSIDVLFQSAAQAYQRRLVAVQLTGASEDGAAGAVEVVRRGGIVLVEAPVGARSPVAPRAVLARVPSARVGTLAELGALIVRLITSQ